MKSILLVLFYILVSTGILGHDLKSSDSPRETHLLNKTFLISSNIKSSLFETGIEKGLTSNTVMKLIDVYKNLGVDFKKDITPESKLEVLLERSFDNQNGSFYDEKVTYTSLTMRKKTISLYRYKSLDEKEEYFDQEGISIKNFIQPLNGNYRISSKFGNRKHPISGKLAFHKGVDYAIKTGTPIHATADGVIDYIGNNGGYGNYIRIKHKDEYVTCYAHIKQFSNNIKLGSKVKRGQIIAYVGSTGNATGPHLHYEIIHHGKHIDPLTLRDRAIIEKLIDFELKKFRLFIGEVETIIQKLKKRI